MRRLIDESSPADVLFDEKRLTQAVDNKTRSP